MSHEAKEFERRAGECARTGNQAGHDQAMRDAADAWDAAGNPDAASVCRKLVPPAPVKAAPHTTKASAAKVADTRPLVDLPELSYENGDTPVTVQVEKPKPPPRKR